jgi:hypothetical protein
MDKTKREWLLARLREPSTWRGIALMAGVLGLNLNPELLPQIGSAVAAFIAVLDIARKEG